MMVLLLVGVAGIPPMGSFWAEYYIFASIFSSFYYGGVVLFLRGVLSLLFLCYLGLWVCHGELRTSTSKVSYGGDRSILCILGHWLPCLILFFFMYPIYI